MYVQGCQAHTYTHSGKHGVFLGRTLNITRTGKDTHTVRETWGFPGKDTEHNQNW